MAVLDIVRLGHPALRTPAREVASEEFGSPALERLIDDLVETMRAAGCGGLSAPQVGAGSQVFVYEVPPSEAPPATPPRSSAPPAEAVPLTIVVNPVLHGKPGRMVHDWEGCSSVPDLLGLVPRHPEVRLRGLDREGQPVDRVVSALESRIVQHEHDHLNGIVFLDRMRDLKSLTYSSEWSSFVERGEQGERTAVV